VWLLPLGLLLVGMLIRWNEDERTGRFLLGVLVERFWTWLVLWTPGMFVAAGTLGLGLFAFRMLIGPARPEPTTPSGTSAAHGLTTLEILLLAGGCGLALMPMVVTLAGSLGLSPPPAMAGAMILGLVTGLAALIRGGWWRRADSVSFAQPPSGRVARLALFLCRLGVGTACLYLFIGAFAPALVFDVTEYHLGAFADFAAAGGFVPVAHNFYARFPWPVQSLYYASLWLGGGWNWSVGAWSDMGPKILNGFLILGAAGVAWAWVRRVVGPGPSWAPSLAGLLVLSQPVLLEVSLDAYIDGPIAYLAALAIYGLWLCGAPGVGLRLLPVTGLCVGAVLATKYTVLQHWALPAFVCFGLPVLVAAWRGTSADRSRAIFALILAFVPLSFWLARNALLYGNPVEPFAAGLFHGASSLERLQERYYIASHFPQPPWTLGYWQTLPRRLAGFDTVALACALFPLILAIQLGAWRRIRAAANSPFPWLQVLAFVLLSYLSWNTVRESQQRFLLPIAPVLAAAAATGLVHPAVPAALRRIGFSLLLLLSLSSLVFQGMRIHHAGMVPYALQRERNWEPEQQQRLSEYYGQNLGSIGRVAAGLAAHWNGQQRLLLVHEARPYLFRPGTQYCTIWDKDPLLEATVELRQKLGRIPTAEELRAALLQSGLTHVLVNREELLRYIRQYARPAQYARYGISLDDPSYDPAQRLFLASPVPEDHYPPYLNSPHWPELRQTIREFLQTLRPRATLVEGRAPFEVWVTPLQSPTSGTILAPTAP
jgi:hypothetical protein